MARNQTTKESSTNSPTSQPSNSNPEVSLLGKEQLPPVPPSEEIVITEPTVFKSVVAEGPAPTVTIDDDQHITIK